MLLIDCITSGRYGLKYFSQSTQIQSKSSQTLILFLFLFLLHYISFIIRLTSYTISKILFSVPTIKSLVKIFSDCYLAKPKLSILSSLLFSSRIKSQNIIYLYFIFNLMFVRVMPQILTLTLYFNYNFWQHSYPRRSSKRHTYKKSI